MPRKLTAVLATMAIGAFAAGCGDDDDEPAAGGSTSPLPAETTPAGEAPATTGSVEVGMKDIAFDPTEVTAEVGQKIVWTNNEGVPHNVVANDGADFKSDTFGEGGTFEFTPTEAGTIRYECTLHPGMEGTVTVTG